MDGELVLSLLCYSVYVCMMFITHLPDQTTLRVPSVCNPTKPLNWSNLATLPHVAWHGALYGLLTLPQTGSNKCSLVCKGVS